MPRWIGLDLHKEYAHGYEWDPEKNAKRDFRLPSDPKAWSKFIENQVDRETAIAIEATGNAFHVYDILSPHAGNVVVPMRIISNGTGMEGITIATTPSASRRCWHWERFARYGCHPKRSGKCAGC